jgi:hypothetical protein
MTDFIIDFSLLVVCFALAIAVGVLLSSWGRR